ncbi:MAG: cyclic-di-AMP receptor [Chloroflexi bacterium]|nr:cyclic-di-AMP receptor [Chloroflexota bacterium]MCC6897118.1 cyclic-di-AMP receptor [Anaerolineae bacterium]
MKLIVTIVDDQDADKVMSALSRQHIGVTRVSSTGGLIDPGNSTLLIGTDEGNIPTVMKLISEVAAVRPAVVPYAHSSSMAFTNLVEIEVGGFTTFVLDIDHFEQV